MKSFKHLIGITYEEMNCWEAVRLYYKDVMNITLKNFQTEDPLNKEFTNEIICSEKGNFKKVNPADRMVGDIIVISIRGIESHIAVYVGDGNMFHSSHKVGSVVESVRRWENLITGYYRLWEK